MKSKFDFKVNIETNDQTGGVMAVYLQIKKGQSVTTRELAGGAAFADYDRKGRLLGIEMIGPCRVSALTRIATEEPEKKFLRESIPRGMLVTA